LSVIFSTITVMAVKGAHFGFAEVMQPMPSEEVLSRDERWAILPPYSDWEVRIS
jgi:hypothetical protein